MDTDPHTVETKKLCKPPACSLYMTTISGEAKSYGIPARHMRVESSETQWPYASCDHSLQVGILMSWLKQKAEIKLLLVLAATIYPEVTYNVELIQPWSTCAI